MHTGYDAFLVACAISIATGSLVALFFPPPAIWPEPKIEIVAVRNTNKDQDKITQVRSYQNVWPYKRYVQGEWR